MKNGWLNYQDYKRVGSRIFVIMFLVYRGIFCLRLCLVLVNAGFFNNCILLNQWS